MESYHLRQEISCQARTIKSYKDQITVLEDQKAELAYECKAGWGRKKASPPPLFFPFFPFSFFFFFWGPSFVPREELGEENLALKEKITALENALAAAHRLLARKREEATSASRPSHPREPGLVPKPSKSAKLG